MQVLKEEIRFSILNAAKELFLEKGFEMASMNMIAKKAGISKSNLYNYFPSKEDIFYVLTEYAYDKIESVLEDLFNHGSDDNFDVERFVALASEKLISLLTKYKKEMMLIVDCSQGTKFEGTKQAFILRLQEHYISEFKKFDILVEDNDYFFVHYIATSLIEGLLEIIRHDKSDAWIRKNINLFIKYYIRGYSQFFTDDFS
ncbi:TetR/AcrR family transcriptional regulator [Petroclostridium sp. X23]|uniref:TetR/AcrR family transcriptional regulator n=1 Tax=Petroclostridium sp. X23 TaxID=3045146 RepID=UPI0024ADF2C5|nr:TetR/AcrR family transcriptional regulator [Petroclostridium sp. X23]WHH58737.1 TetR/AcrR family transcriptional regulator [Petroclostridium sp. X23]